MEGMTRPEMIEEIEGIENKIKKRLPRGSRISSTKLVDSFLEQVRSFSLKLFFFWFL